MIFAAEKLSLPVRSLLRVGKRAVKPFNSQSYHTTPFPGFFGSKTAGSYMCPHTYQKTHSQKILGHYYKHLVGSSRFQRHFHLQQPLQVLVSRKKIIHLENSKYLSFRNDKLEMVHQLGIACLGYRDTFTPPPTTYCHCSIRKYRKAREAKL